LLSEYFVNSSLIYSLFNDVKQIINLIAVVARAYQAVCRAYISRAYVTTGVTGGN